MKLIYLAISIVVLHTAIPHKHHSEMKSGEDKVAHESSSSFIDILALMFHHDEGDQNLENIELSDFNLDIDNTSLIVLYSYFLAPTKKIEKFESDTFKLPLKDFYLIRPAGHRGPPLV